MPYKEIRFKKGLKSCQGDSDRLNAIHALRTSFWPAQSLPRGGMAICPRFNLTEYIFLGVIFIHDVHHEPTHTLSTGLFL